MPGELELEVVIERMTSGAELYDLPTPRIARGEPANLCLIDLEARFEVGADGYASRSDNCCFHGRVLHGRVLLTLAAGAVAFRRPMLVPATSSRATAQPSVQGLAEGQARGPQG
ncbi:MAG TPA: hypothetical protein VIL82_01485 [Solirubrobacteraceae bacterium]